MTTATGRRDPESFIAEGGGIRPGWKTALGSLISLTVGPSVIAALSFGVFAPHLREAFGWSVGDVGLGVAAMSFAVMVSSALSGLIIDRFGVRRSVLTSIPVFGLCFAALGAQTGELWQFYLGWLLIPLAGICLWPGTWAKATAGWFKTRLGFAVATATIGVGIGATVMPMLINGLAVTQGWRLAYLCVGLGSILVALPAAYFWVHEAPLDKTHGAGPGTAEAGFFSLLRDSRLICLLLAFLALGYFSAAVMSNLILILEGNGMRRDQAVVALSVIGLSTIAGRLLCGWLLDRVAFRIVVPAFCLMSAVAVAGLAGGAAGMPAYVAAAAIGITIGAEIDLLGFAIQRLFGRKRFATLFGVIFAHFHIGGAVGGIIMGTTHDMTGSFFLGLMIASGTCVFAALLFAIMPFTSLVGAQAAQPA